MEWSKSISRAHMAYESNNQYVQFSLLFFEIQFKTFQDMSFECKRNIHS